LHLVMRRAVRQFVFPALRFVQQRRTLNQHRLQLRQLLLLALRCAIICLLAFGLARPTLRGSVVAGQEGAPVAAALVFDNSLRMGYVRDNKSRLDQARELANWLVEQLPTDCPLAVIDRSSLRGGHSLDRSAAELRIERLATSSAVRPWDETLRDSTDWLREQRDHRGEIYVFTDMSSEAWTESAMAEFATRLKDLPSSSIYLIDVGVDKPHNFALANLKLSAEELTPGGLLQLNTDLTAIGEIAEHGDVSIELYLDDAAGVLQKRGQQVFKIEKAGEPVRVEFSLAGMEPGTHQGYVRIVGDDALACDDVRYFTIEVRPPRKVLLVGDKLDDTLFLREALAPSAATGLLRSKFVCDARAMADLGSATLTDYDAVCLTDPTPPAANVWQSLTDYVQSGGGIGVFLGRRAKRDELNEPAPQQLLAAKLRWQSRDPTFLRPTAVEHPALAELRDLGDAVPWSEFPVFKYWELESPASGVVVVASYANGKLALLARRVGSGRALTMTTSVSDPAGNHPWNLLPSGPDPWPYLALANGLVEYLAGAGDARFNYWAGQTVMLHLAADEQLASYVLQLPGSNAVRQSLTPGQRELSITSTAALGNYRVRAGGENAKLDRGFSINCPAAMSQLARVDFTTIAKALGEDRVRLAHNRDEIEIRVGLGRMGRELFPAVIVAMALVLGTENILANRFYQR
jgi:Aerotolerance regulator N-terminal